MHDQNEPMERAAARDSAQERPRSIILVVEDSEDDFFLLQRVFKKRKDEAEMAHVENGADALKYLASAKENPTLIPVLVLLDLKLPGVSGFEVLKWLRKEPAFKRVVVNVLSSSAESSDIEECFRLGANAYTVKPIGLNEYDEIIGGLFRFWFELSKLPEVNNHQLA